MASSRPTSLPSRFFATDRKDAWWIGPFLTVLVLGGFVVYGTFRAIYNAEFEYGYAIVKAEGSTGESRRARLPDQVLESPQMQRNAWLLSPFYSPLLLFPNMPAWLSPAFLILWAPGGFRLTCYYYRKAYYRAFFLDPPGCAVGEGRKRYSGERGLFIFQNAHRFFLYLALAFIVILSVDVVHAAMWPTGDGGYEFGFSIGTLVLLINVVLLAGYTFSCHSFRHMMGGGRDCFSCPLGKQRYGVWNGISFLNRYHMEFAWVSLFGVALADVYIWMLAAGALPYDFRIL